MAAKKPLTKNDVEVYRIRHATIRKAIDGLFGVSKTFFRCAAWAAVVWFLFLAARVLAGTSTKFEAIVYGVLKLSMDRQIMGLAILLLGGAYARERKLRNSIPHNRAKYIRELETRADPNRTSSHLDDSGRPQKDDLDAA